MIHKHNLVTVIPDGTSSKGPFIRLVCAELGCGEVRDVYNNGDVVVVNEGLPDTE